jgi:PKD repeat protein
MKARRMFKGLVVLALLLPLLLIGDPALTRAAEPPGALNCAESDVAHLSVPLNEKGSTAAATEPSAVQFNAENVELVGHIGVTANEVFVQGNYAYIGEGSRLTTLDISDPAHPTEVGYYDTLGYADDIHVSDSYTYTADGSGGLPILQYTGAGLFSLSGHIHDSSDHPISNVTVSAGADYSTTTDASGVYTITDLVTGTYTLTPTAESSAKNDWTFEPPTRTVSVPPDATGQDFTILPGPISTTLKMSGTASIATLLIYTDTQGLTTTLDFPSGSVPQTTTIILTPTLATDEIGLAFAGHAFDLEAYQNGSLQPGLIFSAPVTVTIHYSDDDVQAVTDESELALWWWTGSEWQNAAQTCDPVPSYTRDTANNVLEVPICHLSLFGLFGPGSSHRIYLPLVVRDYEPIRADFTASPLTGTAPLTVTFTNESSGAYTSSLWRFGDGFTSTMENPAHTYVTTGTYTVTLTISGPGGSDEEVKSNYITVAPPQSDLPIPVSSVLTPFDANLNDLGGPSSWTTRYGKTPEIIVASNGVELDVLAQDYDPESAWNAVLLHIEPYSTGYGITQALTDTPMLDRVMGLANDGAGNRYYATGVDEDDIVDPTYPPTDTYRSDIVRVIKLDSAVNIQFNIDLDTARYAYNSNAEMIINPMVASTSRLAVGGNEIALVHGINTDPDWNIGGTRHQKALSTRLDATSGAVTRTSSVWVSHSFDQRLLYDGEGIIEHHLGDAYPRYIVFGRNHTSYPLFHIKGDLGENNTRTRLGDVALIENDPTYGYIALFATEDSADTGSTIDGPRNLAIVRVNSSDNSIDPSLPDTLTVTSCGEQYTNRLRWLTHYSTSSNLHAERPKLVGMGGDQYVVLWEEWLNTGDYSDTFNGVHGMVIDDEGNVLHAAALITDEHHLHRGDDAFLLDNRAAWMTGNEVEQKLYIHLVDTSLDYEMVTLD